MNKYIDAEKLIAEIERRMNCYDRDGCEPNDGKWVELVTMKHFIESLQQEQPEVDLEKEMDEYYGMYRDKTGKTYDIEYDEPCFDWKEDGLSEHKMRMAIHFYELGLNAKKEN